MSTDTTTSTETTQPDRNPDGSPSWVPYGPEADRRRAEGNEYVRLLIEGRP